MRSLKAGKRRAQGYISVLFGLLSFGIGLFGLIKTYPFRWFSLRLIMSLEGSIAENLYFFSNYIFPSIAFILGGTYMALIGIELLSGKDFAKWALIVFSPLSGTVAIVLSDILGLFAKENKLSTPLFLIIACIYLLGISVVMMKTIRSLRQSAGKKWNVKNVAIFGSLLLSIAFFFGAFLLSVQLSLRFPGQIFQ